MGEIENDLHLIFTKISIEKLEKEIREKEKYLIEQELLKQSILKVWDRRNRLGRRYKDIRRNVK